MQKLLSAVLLMLFVATASAQNVSQQIDHYLSRVHKKRSFNGTVLVAYKSEIVFYKGFGFKNVITHALNDTSTIYRIGSLSKPFTATIIMRLWEKKALELTDPINKYLPGYPHGDSITIEHLLTHSSGVKEYLQVKAIQDTPDSAPPISMEKLISYFKDEPLVIRPGQKFSYSNSNYVLLAAIIEKVTGEKFEKLIRADIFEPAQMQHSGFDFRHLDDTSRATGHKSILKRLPLTEDFDSTYAPGCGSVYSTVMDLYRFYQYLYSGKLIADSTREQAFQKRQSDYGYGWFNENRKGRKTISHAGGIPGFLANMQFYPGEDLCIIVLSNDSEGDIFTNSDRIGEIVLRKK